MIKVKQAMFALKICCLIMIKQFWETTDTVLNIYICLTNDLAGIFKKRNKLCVMFLLSYLFNNQLIELLWDR